MIDSFSPDPVHLGYLLAFGAAALACGAGAYRARQIPYAGTRRGLQALLITSGGWALAHVGFLLPFPPAVKSGFYEAGLIIGFSTVWSWLWFCSAYTGRTLHRNQTVRRLALAVFVTVVLVKLTNPWHQLYYTLELTESPFPHLAVRHHLLYWVAMGLSYALAATGYLMLLELFVASGTNTRPLAVLTGITALPAVLNVLGHARPALLDFTHEPLGVAAFAVGTLFTYLYQFESVRLASGRKEPALTLTSEGRLGDYNRSAADLFSSLGDRAHLGEPLADVLPDLAAALEAGRSPFVVEKNGTRRYFRIAETQFGPEGRAGNRLVVLVDTTARERRERALSRRQRKVEALYAATIRLLRADERQDVSTGVRALVHDVFGYPFVEVRFERDGTLVPHQHPPDGADATPSWPPVEVGGASALAEAYRTGEPLGYDDVHRIEDPIDYADARATAFIPVDDHGTIAVGARRPGAIDAFDRRLIEVLAATAAAVLDRIDRETSLVEAKEEAERMGRIKSAFLANVSHEVRTPLTSIIGFAETISEEAGSADEGAVPHFAQLIKESGSRLMETLSGILNLSKLEAGEMDLAPEPVDLAEEVEAVCREFRSRANRNGIDLVVEGTGGPRPGHVSRAGLQVVLRNLLSNAIKYTRESGTVRVRVHLSEEGPVLEVEDTGIGMDPDQVARLFEPFQQASTGLNRDYEGVGLGLTITQQAVEQMGGSLTVDTAKGDGTRVAVQLPPAQANGLRRPQGRSEAAT
jgi:signal transduction histidine kinase